MNRADTKRALLNEARILGHAEAQTKTKAAAALELVEEGKFVRGGRMGRFASWYRLSPAQTEKVRREGHQVADGPRVRFLANNLGASEADNLTRLVHDTYGIGDSGIVAFEHPNQKACAGWVYVEVDSKMGTPRKLYVGVAPDMYEVV